MLVLVVMGSVKRKLLPVTALSSPQPPELIGRNIFLELQVDMPHRTPLVNSNTLNSVCVLTSLPGLKAGFCVGDSICLARAWHLPGQPHRYRDGFWARINRLTLGIIVLDITRESRPNDQSHSLRLLSEHGQHDLPRSSS